MYSVIGYSAGIIVLSKEVEEDELQKFLASTKEDLKDDFLSITFALCTQKITEICVDVFEMESGKYREDLSVSFKK